jgi:hypothetical protein
MINSTVPSTQNQPITRSGRAAALALLVGILFTLFALPAQAATTGNTGGSGVGTPQAQHSGQPTGSSGGVLFGGLCLAAIVATAGGVLWYTVRNRRTLEN